MERESISLPLSPPEWLGGILAAVCLMLGGIELTAHFDCSRHALFDAVFQPE